MDEKVEECESLVWLRLVCKGRIAHHENQEKGNFIAEHEIMASRGSERQVGTRYYYLRLH